MTTTIIVITAILAPCFIALLVSHNKTQNKYKNLGFGLIFALVASQGCATKMPQVVTKDGYYNAYEEHEKMIERFKSADTTAYQAAYKRQQDSLNAELIGYYGVPYVVGLESPYRVYVSEPKTEWEKLQDKLDELKRDMNYYYNYSIYLSNVSSVRRW